MSSNFETSKTHRCRRYEPQPGERSVTQTQELIPHWNQKALEDAVVWVVGAGGLGGPFALGLVQSGVGELHVCDHDDVEASNLNRQFFTEEDLGLPKAHCLAKNLQPHGNLGTTIVGHALVFDALLNASPAEPSLIFLGVDNHRARIEGVQAGLERGVPVVCATLEVEGHALQVSVQEPDTACLKCILGGSLNQDNDKALPCGGAPVTEALPGLAAHIAAHAALSILAGGLERRWNELTFFPELGQAYPRTVDRRADCPVCGERR